MLTSWRGQGSLWMGALNHNKIAAYTKYPYLDRDADFLARAREPLDRRSHVTIKLPHIQYKVSVPGSRFWLLCAGRGAFGWALSIIIKLPHIQSTSTWIAMLISWRGQESLWMGVLYHKKLPHTALWNRNYLLRFRFRFLLLKSYGSGSNFRKVMVPVPVPTFEKFRFRFQLHI